MRETVTRGCVLMAAIRFRLIVLKWPRAITQRLLRGGALIGASFILSHVSCGVEETLGVLLKVIR